MMNSSEFMNRLLFALLLTSFTLFAGVNAVAQDAQQQSGTQQTLLPEIDPQDIEIRSQFQARFPGLRRQPILGFNPRPRVFQIDPNRTPFFEDEETVVANLPIGVLDRPEPPRYMPLGYSDPQNGFARIGIGSYFTPEADVYAVGRLNEKNRVSANINHLSTDGHLDGFKDSFRNSKIEMRSVHRVSGKTTVQTNLGVKSMFNHYPGMILQDGEPGDDNTRTEALGTYGGFDLNYAQTSLSGVRVGLDGFSNQFDLTSDQPQLEGDAIEWGINGYAEYSRLGGNVEEVHRIKLATNAGGFDPLGAAESGSWSVTKVTAHYERLFNYQTEVKAGAGFSGVSDAVNDFSFYPVADVSITHNLFSGLDLKAHLSAAPSLKNMGRVYSENRFVDFNGQLQHQYEWRGLAEVQIEPVSGTTFTGGVSYQNIKNYLYYTRNNNVLNVGAQVPPVLTERYYGLNFENANFFKLYGAFSQDLKADVIWIQADGAWQRPRLSNDEKIPFIESLSIKGTIAFRPFSQLVVEGWGEYVGSRNDSEGDEMSSFINLGGRFEISLNDRLGVYGKLVNLLDEEYELWQGYPERGFQGYIGITYLF